MSELLKVSSNPHVRARMKTDNIMLLVLIALLPSAFFGVVNFGLRSLAVLAVSVASCLRSFLSNSFSAAWDRTL